MRRLITIAILAMCLLAVPALAIQYIVVSGGSPPAGWNPSLSSDANLWGWYQFETDAGTDSETSNGAADLTAVGDPSLDTSNYIEGAGSVDFTRITDQYYITDANLPASHPLKAATGAGNFSVAFWVQFDEIGGERHIFSKYNSSSNDRTIQINVDTTPRWVLRLGWNSGASLDSYYMTTPAPLVGTWFHVCFSYTESTDAMLWRIYKEGDTAYTSATTTTDEPISFNDADLIVAGGGAYTSPDYPIDGRMDEVLIFDKALTSGECDDIRNGNY